MSFRYVVALLFFLSCLAVSADAQTVSGQVVFQGGGHRTAQVTVQSARGSFSRTTVTDASGHFTVVGVPAGETFVTVQAEGFVTVRERVDSAETFRDLQFTMRPAPGRPASSTGATGVSVNTLRAPPEAVREFQLGEQAMQRKQWETARKHFEAALAKHADFPHALRALAMVDLAQQKPEAAVPRLEQAIKLDESFADGFLTLGHVLNSLGRHGDASDAAAKAIKLQPASWQGHYELGMASLALGKLEQVDECAQKVRTVGGEGIVEAGLLRAGAALKRGKYAEAGDELRLFLKASPNHPYAGVARKTLEQVEQSLVKK